MEFVIIMILFDMTDYRLLYGNCSISFSPRSEKYKHDSQDFLRMFISKGTDRD